MRYSSGRNKGREFEKAIARMIRERGLDDRARRALGSGSGGGGDVDSLLKILWRPVHLEAKNQKIMSIETWWKQTEKQCKEEDAIPLLVFKFHRESMKSAKAVIKLDVLLDLIANQNE